MARKPQDAGTIPVKLKTRLRMKHLELFRQVAQLQSLRQAAAATSMTQPAATKLVHEMEEMFGLPLFHRDRRGMQLTEHGEAVRRHIQIVMADVANMYADVHLLASGGTGLLRLGIIPSLSSDLLARSINELITTHPRARMQMREASADELLQQLAANDLDVLFGRVLHGPAASNLRITRVYAEAFDIVCAKTHPLARRRNVSWRELSQQDWVLPATGPLREMAEDMFTAHGVLRPQVALASGSFHRTRQVIASGRLLGILPQSLAAQRQPGEIVSLRTGGAEKFAPISLIARKDIEQPQLVREFEHIVLSTARALGLR